MKQNIFFKLKSQSYIWEIIELSATEELGQPSTFDIIIIPKSDNKIVLRPGNIVSIDITTLNKNIRSIIGYIHSIKYSYSNKEKSQIILLNIQSTLYTLNNYSITDVYVNQTINDILYNQLTIAGYTKNQIKLTLNKTYYQIDYLVQSPYETNLDFFQRIIAMNQLFYWFEVENNLEIIHISDKLEYDQNMAVEIQPDEFQSFSCKNNKIFDAHPSVHKNNIHKSYKDSVDIANKYAQDIKEKIGTFYENNTQTYHLKTTNSARTIMQCINYKNKISKHETYVTTKIQHKYKYDILATNRNINECIHYETTATLHPSTLNLTTIMHPALHHPSFFYAKIESPNDHSHMDKNAHHHIKGFFNLMEKKPATSSPPIKHSRNHSDTQNQYGEIGSSIPLLNNTIVLVTCLNGDPSTPIILGTLPSNNTPAIVTNQNPYEHRFDTKNSQKFVINDTPSHEQILINNYQDVNILSIKVNQIDLKSKGGMNFKSGADLTINSQKSSIAIINNHQQIESQRHTIKSLNGNIQLQAQHTSEIYAQNNLEIKAQKNITIKSNGKFSIQANKQIKISSIDDQQWIAKNTVNLSAKSNIITTATQSIVLKTGDSIIELHSSGIINIKAPKIFINSDNNIDIYGKIDTKTQVCTTRYKAIVSKNINDIPLIPEINQY